MSTGERQLAALAAALITDKTRLTPSERKLIARAPNIGSSSLIDTLKKIRAGSDPLGEMFCMLRSAEDRRELGAIYTPASIVNAMVTWAHNEQVAPVRIVDPGAGSGRYLVAAARCFPRAKLIAIDIDPLAVLILRANASVLGFAKRLDVHLGDYRALELPEVDGATLFIGNPPYVRHHDIGEKWKVWFSTTASRFNISASKLAGLHIHFFLKTRELARPGDFGTFITAAEWLDVNYGSALRKMLADGLGGSAVHIIDPKAQPFDNTLTTGAITCFHVGNRAKALTMRSVDSLAELTPLTRGKRIPWRDLRDARKWSIFVRTSVQKPAGFIELGELFRVHRGQVTGNNAVWIEGAAAREIPARLLRPAVTRARELMAAGAELVDRNSLKRVIDLPSDLSELGEHERLAVERFLAWARLQKVHEGYIAKHRKAWWSVGFYDPAPVLCTYMARRPPAFVRNRVGATHLNIAHGLYPRGILGENQLEAVLAYLRNHVGVEGGRVYAGGLVKFEPGEVARLHIPEPSSLVTSRTIQMQA